MAACRACLTPRPRVPPARPDSSAACLAALLFCGGAGGFPQISPPISVFCSVRLFPPLFFFSLLAFPRCVSGGARRAGVSSVGGVLCLFVISPSARLS